MKVSFVLLTTDYLNMLVLDILTFLKRVNMYGICILIYYNEVHSYSKKNTKAIESSSCSAVTFEINNYDAGTLNV